MHLLAASFHLWICLALDVCSRCPNCGRTGRDVQGRGQRGQHNHVPRFPPGRGPSFLGIGLNVLILLSHSRWANRLQCRRQRKCLKLLVRVGSPESRQPFFPKQLSRFFGFIPVFLGIGIAGRSFLVVLALVLGFFGVSIIPIIFLFSCCIVLFHGYGLLEDGGSLSYGRDQG